MPTISTFFGIAIRMFFSDRRPPHFHVAYQRHRARAKRALQRIPGADIE